MPSKATDDGSGWTVIDRKHYKSCFSATLANTSAAGGASSTREFSPRICISLPSGARIGKSGVIVLARPDTGVLRATAYSVWPDATRGGSLVRLENSVNLDTSRVRWTHYQLIAADGLRYHAGAPQQHVNRTLCVGPSPRTRAKQVNVCGVWWTSRSD